MRQRVITAVIALAFFLPIIYIGGIAIELLAALLAGIGVFELFRMKGLAVLSFEGILAMIGAVILVLPQDRWFAFLPDGTDKSALYYFVVLLLLGIAVISKNTYTFDEAGFPVLASLYTGVGFERFLTARSATDGLVVLVYSWFGPLISVLIWRVDALDSINFGRIFRQTRPSKVR